MVFLHQHQIIHMDLKPHNVLISDDLHAKVWLLIKRNQGRTQGGVLGFKPPHWSVDKNAQ